MNSNLNAANEEISKIKTNVIEYWNSLCNELLMNPDTQNAKNVDNSSHTDDNFKSLPSISQISETDLIKKA